MSNPTDELIETINVFISGRDRSQAHVDRIEGLLIEHFMDTDLYEELATYLASYSPIRGGEKHLYSEDELARELIYVLEHYLRGGSTDR
jgi:hypothetical protein